MTTFVNLYKPIQQYCTRCTTTLKLWRSTHIKAMQNTLQVFVSWTRWTPLDTPSLFYTEFFTLRAFPYSPCGFIPCTTYLQYAIRDYFISAHHVNFSSYNMKKGWFLSNPLFLKDKRGFFGVCKNKGCVSVCFPGRVNFTARKFRVLKSIYTWVRGTVFHVPTVSLL